MIFNFKGSARLKREILSWVEENLITEAQAEKLYQKYELQGEAPWYLRSGFILKGLALLLTGMGILLIISENWQRFNVPTRMSFGLVPLFVAYGLGFKFLYAKKKDAAELAFFFAGIMFGVNIFLQAQIFHISAYYPNGLLWWIIGTLPVALYFRSSLHHLLVQSLYFIWMTRQLEYSQFSPWAPLLFAGMLYLLYLKPNKLILLATILNSYLLIYNLNSFLAHDALNAFWLIFVAATLLILLLLQLLKSAYEEKYLERIYYAGSLAILFIFYLHTFEEVARAYAGNHVSIVGFGLLALLAIFWIKLEKSPEFMGLLLVVEILLVLHLTGIFYSGEKGSFGATVIIFTNLLFFGYAVWYIGYGIHRQVKHLFMTGVLMVVVLAISRYLDLFDNYILTAVIFILSGLFVYFINQYWDRRYE